jgi:putative DNA primase/helicase
LTAIAERHDLAVLASIHFNKAPSVDVLTRISGSGGIANAARCILCCATDPEDESRRLFWRELSNLAPGKQGCSYRLVTKHVETDHGLLETSGVEWGGAVDVDSRRVLAGPSEEGEHHERDEAVEFLLDLLSDGPVSARDVEKQAKAARISQATLRRAKAQLKVRSRKIGAPGEPGEWRWCLPEGAQATPEDVEDAHLSDVSAFDAFGASSQEAGP